MDEITNNKVLETNREKIESLKVELATTEGFHIVEMSGANIQSWKDYISEIQMKFKFPTSCLDSMDRYLDWIRDLDWLDKDGYVLIIYGYSDFLKDDPRLKKEIITDFTDVILPFWQEEVKEVVVEGKAKSFMVYLVE
ncbi:MULTISPECIES: barstar family protein [Brevibacillus]|uniref:barstar family protein n=1 Tax=Brevibacillus TaxID=55080 RepID=UPI00156B1AAD|nr:barstar family protein [Brevibacillus sp. RS1.1]NRR01975.1 barstar family protein [Brevibacillus sp. RS1.1]